MTETIVPKKKTGLTRDQATELYKDLQKAMSTMKQRQSGTQKNKASATSATAKQIADSIKSALNEQPGSAPRREPLSPSAAAKLLSPEEPSLFPAGMSQSFASFGRGRNVAVMMVVLCALARFTFSALESTQVFEATSAEASVASASKITSEVPGPQFSKEQFQILTTLDSRRAELEERAKKVGDREQELTRRDQEYVVRFNQLRELTQRLGQEREKSQHKRDAQLDQLANVYGSMDPAEAAKLMQQLDVTIALSLIHRMPEKRIGQILSLMSSDKALAITRMLSGRALEIQ